MPTAWGVARLIMEAVPSCETHRIYQVKDEGDPEAVLREANVSGMNGLLGVIRGRITGHFSRDSQEALFLFCDVERLRRIKWSQPQFGLTAAWDYLENLAGRVKVIGEVADLPRDLEILAERAKNIVIGDLKEEIVDLQSQVENILRDWSRIDLAEAVEIRRQIDEIPGLITTGQEFATMVEGSKEKGDRRNGKRFGKQERRRHNQNWRERLYVDNEERATAAS